MTPDPSTVRREIADPQRLCSALSLTKGAKRQARGLVIRCPWHPDRTPSCSVAVEKDGTIWCHCFSCGAKGDALDLIAQVRGLDVRTQFATVLEEAAALAGIRIEGVPDMGRDAKRSAGADFGSGEPRRRAAPALADDRFAAIVAPLLHLGRLDDSAAAADATSYLAGRGLLESAREDGWAAIVDPEALGRLLADCFPRSELEASGLLRRGRVDHPDNRLAIPWRSPDGVVYTWQRRRLDGERDRKYVFPSGRPARWPYGVERLTIGPVGGPIVFVEGAVDTLARRALDARAGVQRVVLGVPGTDGWRPEWAELARGREAIVATDADDPGARAADRWARDLHAAGAARVTRLEPAGAHDWAEVLAA